MSRDRDPGRPSDSEIRKDRDTKAAYSVEVYCVEFGMFVH